eukprot:CAMPEP_0180420472 /NCGR_PEP_ID=MMETSP1036_2-20121128/2651_1 /TAXON_ID=632150 /ORGANISM="Azadinium spinosum, Strain 3D9" /LENGTH=300 /DNA_ID=CAMNT_0022425703 /DNA_START=132 /DNA_END=1030 /DNA_ORIENTATION=+
MVGQCLNHAGNVGLDIGLRTTAHDEVRKKFANGLLELVQSRSYEKQVPVVVNLFDSTYSRFLAGWAHRVATCGMTQQVVVALDIDVLAKAAAKNLPALTGTGIIASQKLSWLQDQANTTWNMPMDFAELKMLTPKILLSAGFHRVIVSEADVFWVTTPLSLMQDTGDFAAMLDSTDIDSRTLNIGFMIFTGTSSVRLLDRFLNEWRLQRVKTEITSDQKIFNNLLFHDPLMRVVGLPAALFAVRPTNVGAHTRVLHCAWTTPPCKQELLSKFYENAVVGPGDMMTLTKEALSAVSPAHHS